MCDSKFSATLGAQGHCEYQEKDDSEDYSDRELHLFKPKPKKSTFYHQHKKPNETKTQQPEIDSSSDDLNE